MILALQSPTGCLAAHGAAVDNVPLGGRHFSHPPRIDGMVVVVWCVCGRLIGQDRDCDLGQRAFSFCSLFFPSFLLQCELDLRD